MTITRWLAAIAVAASATPAAASTIRELSPDALAADAERIVDATVIARETAWNAAHTGLETRVVLSVEATWKGTAAATLEIVVPGGELGGARHLVVGTPSVEVGETARWFLRDRGDGRLAVYGWAQGKWPVRVVGGVRRFAPSPVAAEQRAGIAAFATNGMVWPAARIPVPYLVQTAGSADLPLPDVIAAVDAAFATWQAVPCATLAFQNAGPTDLGVAVDGDNVVLFVESGWTYGREAAAATSLWIIDGQQTADIAVNGENFRWAIGPAGALAASGTLDLQAVLTHEIGHFSGLGHTERAFDTMYYSWKPWPGQRTLSIDDKLGLCSIYGVAGDECAAGCPAGETCFEHPLGKLCAGAPDPIGAACNYDRVECDAFCLFTAVDLSVGYCSRFCDRDADCPLTHHCAAASAGGTPVKVCFAGAQPLACGGDDDCDAGQHCGDASVCTFECRGASDCDSGVCDARGRCSAADEDGGCSTGAGGALAMAALGWLGLLSRKRRRAGA
jgi:hypothetical protein